jgi:hypothetical protein
MLPFGRNGSNPALHLLASNENPRPERLLTYPILRSFYQKLAMKHLLLATSVRGHIT